jgi:FKBP-type peptidyl-prolyl cis-trans isomerase (trigger factor)
LVVTRIAEANQLTATEKDLDARIEEIAKRSSVTPSEVYSGLQRAGRLERLEREITEENVFRFLKERSEVS